MPVITKRLLDAVKPDGKLRIIRDDDLTGFGVQVTPAGKISFCITYTTGTKSRRRVIGNFGRMTVETARKTAFALLASAASGEDPLPDENRHLATITDLFETWMERHVSIQLKASTAQAYRLCYDTHCRKRFGHIPPSKLDFKAIADAHVALAKTPTAANHMLRTMRAMLSWASDQRLISWKNSNPGKGHRLHKETPSDRILSVPEIRRFIQQLPNAIMHEGTRRALLIQLLLGQRSSEIAGMRKSQVDLIAATWTFADNKSSRPHVVPLPPWSRELIAAAIADAKGPFVFPSPVSAPEDDGIKPIDEHALYTALRRAQRPIGQTGASNSSADASWVFDFRDREGRPDLISPHDLRRTCASYLEVLGYGDFIRGAILNHSQKRNVTAKHYSAADLTKLKRTALLHWEAALRKIIAGEDPLAAAIEDDRAEEARVLGL